MSTFIDRLSHAWNAFMNKDPTYINRGESSSIRPDRIRLTRGNERSIITAICNRFAMDVAAVEIKHVRLDDSGRFTDIIDSVLNERFLLDANKDQTARAFRQDIVMSMFDEGCVAVVPVETSFNINRSESYKIFSMRTAKILEWYPDHVKVRLYNDETGRYEELFFDKKTVAIIENPLYSIMNEPNSVYQRLVRKLNLLDVVDEQSSSGKLNLIIQLPYQIRTEARRKIAEDRKKDIINQLTNNKYGIAYTDSTEKITQLNRSIENNLMEQIEYLTNMLYSQLGITTSILDGTANEQELLNYNNRIIEPILSAIVDEFKRKFLTKTARSQNQSIMFFRDPFKLVPVNNIADIADKFTRNEIMSSNEVRQIVGMKPVGDPQADQLRNKNINAAEGQEFASTMVEETNEHNNYEDQLDS